MTTSSKISAGQRTEILRLAALVVFPSMDVEDRLIKMMRISEDPEEFGMDSDTASRTIDWLKAQPRKPVESSDTVVLTTPGVFESADGIFVVKKNRKGDRLYAKKLVESGCSRVTETDEHVHFDFEYAPGAIFKLREEHRMDVERARELTIRYGRCINCGRVLKAKKSVDDGIGPVCIKSFRQAI